MVKRIMVLALGVIAGCNVGPGPITETEATTGTGTTGTGTGTTGTDTSTSTSTSTTTTTAITTEADGTTTTSLPPDLPPVPDLPSIPDVPGGDDGCEEVETPWNGVEPDDADCTEDGLVFCSNVEAEGPAGSRFWECLGGAWVESVTAGEDSCQFDGFDFAYGCVDNGISVSFVCGVGPGTPCAGPECDACGGDGDAIEYCQDGKLSIDSCLRICTEVGDEQGITYDFGSCVLDGDSPMCVCCDVGDPGCMA